MILSGGGTETGSDNYRVFVGQEVGLMYGYVSDGMYSFDDFTFNPTTKKVGYCESEGKSGCKDTGRICERLPEAESDTSGI